MTPRSIVPLLPLAALVLALSGCGDDSTGRSATEGAEKADESGLVPEDATLAWAATLEENWRVIHVVKVEESIVVSSKWADDEAGEITAYGPTGVTLWAEPALGGALLAPVGADAVLVCHPGSSMTLSLADGSFIDDEGVGGEQCPVADDDADDPVPRNDEAYTLDGNVLTVDGPDGSYSITLEEAVYEDPDGESITVTPEIWGVEGGVVTFVEENATLQYYH